MYGPARHVITGSGKERGGSGSGSGRGGASAGRSSSGSRGRGRHGRGGRSGSGRPQHAPPGVMPKLPGLQPPEDQADAPQRGRGEARASAAASQPEERYFPLVRDMWEALPCSPVPLPIQTIWALFDDAGNPQVHTQSEPLLRAPAPMVPVPFALLGARGHEHREQEAAEEHEEVSSDDQAEDQDDEAGIPWPYFRDRMPGPSQDSAKPVEVVDHKSEIDAAGGEVDAEVQEAKEEPAEEPAPEEVPVQSSYQVTLHAGMKRASAKAYEVRAATAHLAQDSTAQATAVAAAGGAVAAGAGGGAVGLVLGGALGVALGVVPALFTFGLSIPIGAVLVGGAGMVVGTAAGGTAGLVGGGAAGYAVFSRRVEIGDKVHNITETVKDKASKLVGGTGGTD